MVKLLTYSPFILLFYCCSSDKTMENSPDETVVLEASQEVGQNNESAVIETVTDVEEQTDPVSADENSITEPLDFDEDADWKSEEEPPGGVSASPNVIDVKQADGTTIKIKGKGSMFVSYTETIDGYTVVRNSNKVYEYARLVKGDLLPSGVKASNPEDRDANELQYLKKATKNLRYQSPKLEELLKEQKKFQDEGKQ